HIGSFDVRLYLAGYGDDPEERERSWIENPLAVALLKRWCELGGLTALSIMSPTTKTPFDCSDAAELGMTADFVWATVLVELTFLAPPRCWSGSIHVWGHSAVCDLEKDQDCTPEPESVKVFTSWKTVGHFKYGT